MAVVILAMASGETSKKDEKQGTDAIRWCMMIPVVTYGHEQWGSGYGEPYPGVVVGSAIIV